MIQTTGPTEGPRAPLQPQVIPRNGDAVLRFPTLFGRTYQPQHTATLSPTGWTPLGSEIPGTSAEVEVTHPGAFSDSAHFYRVIVSP